MKNKILITDDMPTWLAFHTILIKQLYGELFDITTAASAASALSIALENRESPFSVVITDLQMENNYYPKLAGEWFVENLQTIPEYKTSKIIMISGMYNIEQIAQKYNVECISKSMIVQNKLLMKYMFEKLMPFLTQM
ncbi:hypothetical protein IJ182_11130 [bacterium]|nr:hypothetical protein [bacterium]